MKPVIGIVPLYDSGKESYWMLPGYMKGLEEAGGIPVMLPLTGEQETLRQLAAQLDGFVLTGGPDVEPPVYGEEKKDTCGETCVMRDEMEQILLPEILKADKPVLGICRGIQLMNAVLGGTLYQDIPTEYPTETEHHQQPPYDRCAHEVIVEKDSLLWKITGKKIIPVNSCHHQAIRDLAPGLETAARSADGLVESVYMKGKRFFLGVQWHPEFSYITSQDSRSIFAGFVQACGMEL